MRSVAHRLIAGVLLFTILAMHGCGGASVPAPTQFANWNDKEGAFSMDYPADWDADGGGKNGIKWAKFTKGSAMIRLDFDSSSSLVGDIASGGQGALNVSEDLDVELAPVHKSHQFNKNKTSDLFSNYVEKEAVPYKSGLGDSRKSEFKASEMMKTIRGYRATSLTQNNGVLIKCTCSQKDWDNLKPAFDKVLESLSYGH